MRTYRLSHLSDAILIRDLNALVAQERTTTTAVLAHIAEVDERRLYAPAGYASMRAYCVDELRFSEDAASKRIQAARAAREFPAIFDDLAEGRLHLAGLCLLAPHLTAGNASELVATAAHKSKSEIEQLLAKRFPRTELLPLVQVIPPVSSPRSALAPAQESDVPECGENTTVRHAPGHVGAPVARPRVAPLSAESYALQFTIEKATHDKLRYVQELLSHRLPSGDIAQVFDRALDALVGQLERQKFAANTKPRARSRRPSANPRHIPAHVKHAVWQRDQGRCTFVGNEGQRCSSRKFLQYDHVEPVARGGQATVSNIRIRCSAHNQVEAERTFGAGFMSRKREEARRAAAEARAKAVAIEQARQDIIPWLLKLGYRKDEAQRAAAICDSIPDASLEERVRAALSGRLPASHVQPGPLNRPSTVSPEGNSSAISAG